MGYGIWAFTMEFICYNFPEFLFMTISQGRNGTVIRSKQICLLGFWKITSVAEKWRY